MTMIATAADDTVLYRQTYFSIGGGFVVTEEEAAGADSVTAGEGDTSFSSAAQLLALRKTHTVIRGSQRIGSTWSRLLSTRRTRPAVAS